jgi:hypothetical protein
MLGFEPLERVLPACKKWQWLAVGGSFLRGFVPFRPRLFLRGSSSRIALDRCESEVNLTVRRGRPRQTAAWKKPGHLQMGAPSVMRVASLVVWLPGESSSRKNIDGNAMARFHRAFVLPRSAVPSRCGAEAGRHALEGRRIVRSKRFEDCAGRFARPGIQNKPSEVRPA